MIVVTVMIEREVVLQSYISYWS